MADDQLLLFGAQGHPTRPRPTRERDPLFDAVAHVCKINPQGLTASGRGMMNRALKELREAHATPEQVIARASAYVERWRHTPTPGALARHWAALDYRPAAPRVLPREVGPLVSVERMRELAAKARAWRSEHSA